MKRFAFRLSIFLALMLILDRGFGLAMKYMQNHAKGGYIGHHNYILNETNEDILIFGSSKAIHHYNPQILMDSLGMSCYNCGQDGNGIVMFYGWWELMKERYHPKMIIYDVYPGFDLLVGKDNTKYLGWLRSEYDDEDIKRIFEDTDPSEKYKMQSMMYRHNSKFLQNITDYLHPLFNISPNGYLPLKGKMDKMKVKEDKDEEEPSLAFDSQKLSYMKTFIREAKERGTQLVFVASPIWYGKDDAQFAPLKEICNKYDILFYNYSNDTAYVHHNEMFKDGSHLNAYGADEFTKEICAILKNLIPK
jgi:hypothetical protein